MFTLFWHQKFIKALCWFRVSIFTDWDVDTRKSNEVNLHLLESLNTNHGTEGKKTVNWKTRNTNTNLYLWSQKTKYKIKSVRLTASRASFVSANNSWMDVIVPHSKLQPKERYIGQMYMKTAFTKPKASTAQLHFKLYPSKCFWTLLSLWLRPMHKSNSFGYSWPEFIYR